jgi:hypothetical protein
MKPMNRTLTKKLNEYKVNNRMSFYDEFNPKKLNYALPSF